MNVTNSETDSPAEPSPHLRWKVAGACALLLLSLPLVLAVRGWIRPELSSESILPFIPNGPQLASRLRDQQETVCLGGLEGKEPPHNEDFLLGVQTLNLATSLRAEDAAGARQIARQMLTVLSTSSTAGSLEGGVQEVLRALSSSPPDLRVARATLLELEQELAERRPGTDLLLGKWVGAGYAALVADAEIFFKSRHWNKGLELLEGDHMTADLKSAAVDLRSTHSGNLEAIRAHLDGLCARLSDGPQTNP